MKKAFGQTVRDLKREVNKKVLQVPKIEQKVLDATSNEPWGPHGTLLADIAQATRNYHEYQIIMSVLWKRISDTGKNWRHVYKGLTVLEYLVANGSERVIDDIKEHAYQISTLSNFQYIDSSGRDQGNNVRRKSQSLVSLVNDKERIVEVREKAAINREKFRPAGGMHRPGSYSGSGGYGDRYDDDRYGSRDEDRYNYGYDDKYGRGGDSYSRDGERYEERYGRDGYKDDSYMGRSRSVDDFQNGPRSRSPDIGRALDDDGQYSSRGSGARTEDTSVDGRPIDRKFSEQNLDSKYSEQNSGAPPSYEEAVGESRSPVYSERDGDAPVASAPQSSSPPVQSNTVQEAGAVTSQEFEAFDEFDPRSSFPAPNTSINVGATISEHAAPAIPSNPEMDLIGSFTDPFTADVMALVPATTGTASAADTHGNSAAAATFTTAQSASNAMNQSFEDPFGDGPFKAIPSSENFAGQPNASVSAAPFQPSTNQNAELFHNGSLKADTATNYDFGDSFASVTYAASNVSSVQPSTVSQFSPQGFSAPQQETDILAGILPPSEPSPAPASQTAFSASACEAGLQGANIFSASTQPDMGPTVPVASNTPQAQTGPDQQLDTAGFLSFGEPNTGGSSQTNALVPFGQATELNENFPSQQVPAGPSPFASQIPSQTPNGYAAHFNSGNIVSQQNSAALAPHKQMASHPSSGVPAQISGVNFLSSQGAATSQTVSQTPGGAGVQNSSDILGNVFSQTGASSTIAPQPNRTATNITSVAQPSKDKFETKSTVWNDTLSRGLVNLNISGPKINPLSDIGIDFDALNRKEKRMEKPTTTSVTSTVTMGKAMGSGSGMGCAGAGAIRPSNHMMNPAMGMGGGPGGMGMGGRPGVGMGMGMGGGPGGVVGMGGGPGVGMGMGMGMGGGPGVGMGMGVGGGPAVGMGIRGGYGGVGYGGMGQQQMGMGMGTNMGMNTGMGMGVGQGSQMQHPTGLPPGANVPGGYNSMAGPGGYNQQPYGRGYQ